MTELGNAAVTATEVQIDYDELSKRFDIFELSAQRVVKKTSLVTEIARYTNAILAVYRRQYSSSVYILAAKDSLPIHKLREVLDKAEPNNDITPNKLANLSKSSENDRMVVSLLLRSLTNYNDSFYAYSNTSGRFLILQECDKEKSKVHPVELSFDENLRLEFSMRTFTSKASIDKIKFRDGHGPDTYPIYVIEGFTLRRATKDESIPKEDQYIERQTYNDKYVKTYINIYEETKFSESRAAIVLKTIERFNRQFEGLASLALMSAPVESLIRAPLRDGSSREGRIEFIRQSGVTVVSAKDNDAASRAADCVAARLQEALNIQADKSNDIEKGKLNIHVVSKKPKIENVVDDYLIHDETTVVQHITHDSVLDVVDQYHKAVKQGKKSTLGELDTMLDVCCNELSIKSEISKSRLLKPSKEVLFDSRCSFMMRFGSGPLAGRQAMLSVEPDGKLKFEMVSTKSMAQNQHIEDWMDLEDVVVARGFKPTAIEGIVRTSKGRAAIVHTGMVTMPDASALEHMSKAKPFAVPIDMLDRLIENDELSAVTRDHLKTIKSAAVDGVVPSKKLDKLKGYDKEEAKRIRAELDEYISSEFNRVLRLSRDNNTISEYFNGLFGIGALTVDDLACYWVGPVRKNINQSVANAANLRAVITDDCSQSDMRDMLLPTLAIDFVRAGQMTVLPWPFKHLREWADIQSRLLEQQAANPV